MRLMVKAGLLAVLAVLGTVEGAMAAGTRPLRVKHGVLTVDGLTVTTGLELRIASLQYLYVALPGVGTAVVAEKPFPGAREQRAAFRGNSLTVVAGESRVQLTATNRMLGSLRGPRSAYVRFDPGSATSTLIPALGFGDAASAPAIWPEVGVDVALGARRRRQVKGRQALRTARLCRPSKQGPELCATVHEVAYKP